MVASLILCFTSMRNIATADWARGADVRQPWASAAARRPSAGMTGLSRFTGIAGTGWWTEAWAAGTS